MFLMLIFEIILHLYNIRVSCKHIAEESSLWHQLSDSNNNHYQQKNVHGNSDQQSQKYPASHAAKSVTCSVNDFHSAYVISA